MRAYGMQTSQLLRKLRCGWLRQVAVWAMAPLAFCNSWPVLGCICADGSFSSNCPALRQAAAEGASKSCCKAGRCATSEPDATAESCCQAADDFQQSRADDDSRCLIGRKCCRVVVQSGVLPPLSQPVQMVDGHQLPALFCESVDQIVNLLHASIRPTFVENDTGQQASDLVITLRRLVI
jgi:hypothetical protein